ncbi:hypothetical protein S7335_1323 [Synechococcus sp. PCC 7335]|uniref:type II toxin-antitoxin system RnlB family antitoxin n=1 Tax=Synechococcus sp. (strain ATCC 29403 / PCC 7335) TaxID=91464 RepID=UPI00017EB1CD|nr:type II toxin-antitoxin system RnlB family antitoxin [Synechococcus sp. PCC 7335]EDX82619.1 hypothetical protein S7335_1323 [Synechococcus sp. PCC 7335]
MQDQSFEIKQLSEGYALVLTLNYESPLSYVCEIETILGKAEFSGIVLFDLLLCNGVADNRFVQFTFEGGRLDHESHNIIAVESLDDSILRVSENFYLANPVLIERSYILLDSDKQMFLSAG